MIWWWFICAAVVWWFLGQITDAFDRLDVPPDFLTSRQSKHGRR